MNLLERLVQMKYGSLPLMAARLYGREQQNIQKHNFQIWSLFNSVWQVIKQATADELIEYVWSFCGVGA